MRRRLFVAGALGLAACSPTPPTRLYTLTPIDAPAEAPPPGRRPVVGLGPINFPEYLNRPQLVTRVAPNRLETAELDNWAEPLEGLFTRTLNDNLSRLLATEAVVTLPARRDIVFDLTVEVDVVRFDVDAAGNALLDARWRLVNTDQRAFKVGRARLGEKIGAGEFEEARAAALSNCLGALSREIAAAIEARPR